MLENRTSKGITGSTLKWVAIIAMFINHFGDTVLEGIIMHAPYQALTDTQFGIISNCHYLFHAIGRISMPIFCFLIVEGFLHTKNAKKYFIRLAAFAAISEVPYDFAFGGTLFDMTRQNVFFTLALGLFTLMVMEKYKQMKITVIIVPVIMSALGFYAKLDGSYYGILMITLFYLMREYRVLKCVGVFLLQIAIILIFHESFDLHQVFATLPLILICFYNGKRGMNLKYFFYAFYPGHLLILALLTIFVIIPMYE